MEILSLALYNFRNFSSKKIVFDKDLTVIIGPNGSGKSNILEAISLLCGVRPAHIESDLDLVRFGKSEARVECAVQRILPGGESEKTTLTINFLVIDERLVKKSYLIDGLKKRFVNFLELLSIVVFHPEDLDLVAGPPSARRHHLDTVLAFSDREYWRNISAYNKIITRRNKVLLRIADGKSKPLELGFWDGRLLEHASYVSKKREEFFEFLNSAGPVKKISNLGGFSWQLKQSLLSEEKLLRNRERDIAAGVTLSGPHRDDFRFIYRKRDLAYFGSRGEQRMAVLALKLSELEYLSIKQGIRPILALDDIFSELDWQHREVVLSIVGNQQTIITAAEADSVPNKLLKRAKIIEL